MNKKILKIIPLSLGVLVLSLSLAYLLHAAWTEPGATPPGDNVPPPVTEVIAGADLVGGGAGGSVRLDLDQTLAVTTLSAQRIRATIAGTAAAPAFSWTADPNTGIRRGGTDNLRFVTGGADRVVIDSAGNVGIGTATPGFNLEVVGTIRATTDIISTDIISGDDLIFYGDLMPDGIDCAAGQTLQKTGPNHWDCVDMPAGGVTWPLQGPDGTTGAPSYSFSADPNTGIRRGGTDNLRFVTAGADRVVIDSAGNVGIGTMTPDPDYKLHVAGDVLAERLMVHLPGTGAGRIYAAGNSVGVHLIASDFLGQGKVGAFTPHDFAVKTGTTLIFLDRDTERIGINDWTPDATLDVAGDIRADGDLIFHGDLMPDGATCAPGQILQRTGLDNWDCVDMPVGGGAPSCVWRTWYATDAWKSCEPGEVLTGCTQVVRYPHWAGTRNETEVSGDKCRTARRMDGAGIALRCCTF